MSPRTPRPSPAPNPAASSVAPAEAHPAAPCAASSAVPCATSPAAPVDAPTAAPTNAPAESSGPHVARAVGGTNDPAAARSVAELPAAAEAPRPAPRQRRTHPAVWLPLALVPLAALIGIYYSALRSPRYEPAQPLPFSHDTHTAAHLAAMPCLACHPGAESGARAGMPSAASCMDCHRHILPDDPRLLPLHAAADPDSPVYNGEALRWVRVQALPGHVHFHHGAHARAGISCEECHARPGAAQDHSMSNCVDCHRREGASTDCSTCHH